MAIIDDTAPLEWSADQILRLVHLGAEESTFEEDMAYIRSLGSALLEHAGNRLAWPSETTVFTRLKSDMSCAARKAVFADWPELSMFGPFGSLKSAWDAS